MPKILQIIYAYQYIVHHLNYLNTFKLGYFGDALDQKKKGDCKPCECHEAGTQESPEGPPQCDGLTGLCSCRPHVIGRNCDKCEVCLQFVNHPCKFSPSWTILHHIIVTMKLGSKLPCTGKV